MPELLPLFPLQVVVFPRTPLPLHIFEDRYKEMVGIAIRDRSEFGVVLARKEGIVNMGCSVAVQKVIQRYPDGRLDILTSGRRRFEIVTLNQEKEYLRAEVQFFDDEDGGPPPSHLQLEALAHFREMLDLSGGGAEPDYNDPQLSFQLAQALGDLDFRNVLLGMRSEADRLRDLNQYLAEHLPALRQAIHRRKLAPRNGHAGKHPEP